MTIEAVGARIAVRGIVQGVGFRPFVFALAHRFSLTGWVRNTSAGVEILIHGGQPQIEAFIAALQQEHPPLARIDVVEVQPATDEILSTFTILESQPQPGEFIPVSPDTAICQDCRRELFDPADRRYRYPFINCTNCGPRFSIIQDIPYDRAKTTMSGFEMCPECKQEYTSPENRRFHAQPVACPVCGPQVWFEASGHRLAQGDAAVQVARSWLRQGKILAIKSLGGYQLACDASNPQAVAELRRRKKRSDKPFALMAFDIQAVETFCSITEKEKETLLSRQAPIVILDQHENSAIAPAVAPQQNTLGFMLPYTPLHLLLLEPAKGFPKALVMTSGNLSEEPIAYQDQDAIHRLENLADGFLFHNRDIYMRLDDPVVRIVEEKVYPIRHARGYAPDPIRLPFTVPQILAAGSELKNTFSLTREGYAFLSHHIGDLENFETLRSFEEGIAHYEKLFHIKPEAIACDLHPNYLATRYAQERARIQGLPLIQVQHHHAHLAACLADNGFHDDQPVIGICLDGTGYGSDGAIWGGEILLGNYSGYQRLMHLSYVPLPGGDQAVRNVARMALSHLWAAGIEWETDLPPVRAICAQERNILSNQLTRGLNAPLTSSMGRLFDAAAALIGVRNEATYEGQAAIELEVLADPDENGYYPFEITGGLISVLPLWHALIRDWRKGTPLPRLSARFHNTIVEMVFSACEHTHKISQSRAVALSGGVWQNVLLLKKSVTRLTSSGFEVLVHRQLPANDAGVSLGQAMVAASWLASSN